MRAFISIIAHPPPPKTIKAPPYTSPNTVYAARENHRIYFVENYQAPTNHITIFKGKSIRKTIFQKEWWFSVVDIVEVLTNSERPSVYWTAMKTRVKTEGNFELSTICRQLKLQAPDGNLRLSPAARL